MSELIRILFVNADETFLKPLMVRLLMDGFNVEVAINGQEALTKINAAKGNFHVVVIDQSMGPLDGVDIIFQFRQSYPNIETIILTDRGEIEQGKPARELDAWYMKKPVNPEDLALEIGHAVRFGLERQKSRALQILVNAGERISTSKDINDLYMRLYEEARELLPGLDGFLFSHYEEQDQEVSFPFCIRKGNRVNVPLRKNGNKITEFVLQSKEPLLLSNGDKEFRREHQLDLPDPGLNYNTSEIVAPMFLNGQIIGTINALSFEADIHYTQEQLQVLQAFANQAAMAIRNFQQKEEARQLRDASLALAEKRGKNEVLQGIVEIAQELISSDYTGLILQEEDGFLHKVKPVIPESFFERFDEPRQDGGVTRHVVDTRQPMIIYDTNKEPLVKKSVREIGISSMLAFPLIHCGRVLGVLFAHTFSQRSFDLHDVDLWSAFATQAAAALNNTVEEERRIQDYVRLANELGRLNEKMSLHETMIQVATAGKAVFGSDTCRIAFVDSPTGQVVDWAWAELDPTEYRFDSEPRPNGLTYHVLRTKLPLFRTVGDADDPYPVPELVSKGLKSFASLPLIYGKRLIGVLHCNYLTKKQPFDEQLKTLMVAFCARAAMALGRARHDEIIDAWRVLDRHATTKQDYKTLCQVFTEQAHTTLHAGFSAFFPTAIVTNIGKPMPVELECVLVGKIPNNWSSSDHNYRDELIAEMELIPDGLLIVNNLEILRDKSYYCLTELDEIKAFVAIRFNVTLQEMKDSQIAGLLLLGFIDKTNFEPNDLAGLQSAGNQLVANVVRNNLQSALQESILKRNQQLRSVIDIFEAFIRHDNGQPGSTLSLDFIAEHSLEFLGIDSCTFLEYDQKRSRFLQRGVAGLKSPNSHYTIPNEIFKRRFIDAVDPVEIADVQNDAITRESGFVIREDVQSVIIFPLRVEGEFLGLFFANHSGLKKFSPEEKEAIGLFADFTALVLYGSRLGAELSDTQQKLDRHLFLVWVSMLETTWRHSIVQKAASIRNYALALHKRLEQIQNIPPAMEYIPTVINDIDRLANDIANAPPRVPQSWEMKAETIPLAALLKDVADREVKIPLLQTGPVIDIQVNVESLDSSIQVSGYRRWLVYALESLLQNARGAMPQGGTITISGSQTGKWAEIRIIDTGLGVPAAIQKTLFKDTTPKEKDEKGMGIGGLVVATIVEDHGGTIELELPGPGNTTVLVRLPVSRESNK